MFHFVPSRGLARSKGGAEIEARMKFHFQIGGSRAMMEIGAWMRSVAAREGRIRWQQAVFWMLGLSLVLAPQAKAGLIGYYSFGNWTVTNNDIGGNQCGSVACTNGFAEPADGGLSAVLTGGNSGSAIPGTTDLVIQAIGTGLVQFQYSYFSLDTVALCGSPCDLAGYLINGTFTALADDINQQPGTTSAFAVTAGDVFGFRVETADNLGEPGILTVTDFSAPVPEPGTTSLILVAAAAMVAARVRARS
jgi:hypothetical protein